MNTSKGNRIKVLGLLALPIAALAVVVVLLSWGQSSTTEVEAASPDSDAVFSFGVGGDGQSIDNDECATKGAGDRKCTLTEGSSETLNVYINSFDGSNYGGFTAYFTATGVSFKDGECDEKALGDLFDLSGLVNGDVEVTCAYNPGGDPGTLLTHKGPERIGFVTFNCDADGKITLDLTESVVGATEAQAASLQVNCPPPPPTDTPTPTATPPPKPRIQKLEDGESLVNNWLERQGDKIPPGPRCADGDDVTTFEETMSMNLRNLDPKGTEGELQEIGAFSFEVRFDDEKVCVNLKPSAVWQALIDSGDAFCMIDDKDQGKDLEGIARIGCITVGKPEGDPAQWIDTTTDEGKILATIEVRPQPGVYSQLRPNQDNGVMVQIENVDCKISDIQGHNVTIFSCEDADITFRYLEGDVEPDCQVDVIDDQSVAFRWGFSKGSLFYNERYDLQPSGQVKGDGDIDILDLQFIFGRVGSTCANPHPDQDPQNPKA